MDEKEKAKLVIDTLTDLKLKRQRLFDQNSKAGLDADMASFTKQIADAQAVIDKEDEQKPVKATARRKRK